MLTMMALRRQDAIRRQDFAPTSPFLDFSRLRTCRLPMKSQNACYQVLRKQAKELAKVAKACEKRALF